MLDLDVAVIVTLDESEAQIFQRLLDGERLWSWPNGRLQLGQSFLDVTIVNRLVRAGWLDQNFAPTDVGRSALLTWLEARNTHSLPKIVANPAPSSG